MKKQYYFLVGLFLFTFIHLFAQPDNTALGDIQVASPEVASLAKFSEASNNHFTGAAGVSVPIEVLEEGNLRVPISVNYHASGIRVGDVASRVGMGWALSATGVVSRTILGIEDEDPNGYLNTDYNYTLNSVVNNVSLGDADGEPDLWSYSLPGGISGKFIINKSIDTIIQYPRTDIKIEISGNDLEEFTIITPDGTKYILGQAGNESYDGFIQVGELPEAFNPADPKKGKARNATGPRRQHTEWYLRKMVSYDDNYEINFAYAAKAYIILSPASEQRSLVFSNRTTNDGSFFQGDAGFGAGGESLGAFQVLPADNGRTRHQLPLYASRQWFESKELTSITTSTTQVNFIERPEKREDLDAAPYNDSEIATNLTRTDYQSYALGEIEIKSIGSTYYCKSFIFDYDYFKAFASPIYSFDVRLKLNSIQEISCVNSADKVNPYIFDYYTDDNLGFDFLPWRLTKGRDAYGFYNGEDAFNNQQKFTIPQTTLSVTPPNSSQVIPLTFGTARRQTELIPMRYGNLKSVKYPEKGKNEFIYEANSIKRVTKDTIEVGAGKFQPTLSNCFDDDDASTNCCGTQNTHQLYIFDQAFIDSALIRIHIQDVGCMSEPDAPDMEYDGIVRLVVRDMVTGNTLTTNPIRGNGDDLLDSITIDIKSEYGDMVAGRQYRFELETTECRGFLFFRKKQITETIDNELVGGLRLKEQHSYDRSNNLLTSRFYDYSRKDEPNVSSGIVYKKPYFGQVISGDDITAENNGTSINNVFVKFSWNSTPILALTDIQGYHIGYQSVREYQNNGAFTDFVFQTRSLDVDLGNSLLAYPIAPLRYFYDNGRMIQQKQGGNDGSNDFVVAQQGFGILLLPETINQKDAVRVEVQSGEAGTLLLTNRFQWQHSGFYQAARDTSIIDGVRTITTYDYSSFPRKHLQPNQVTMTNSDGEETVNKIRYPYEIVNDGDLPNQSVYQEMIDRNMIGIPIEQTREVDGTLVSGSRSQFNLFFDDPYLEEVYQYETTWDTLGNEITTGWELFGKVLEYYNFGKPKDIQRTNWLAISLEYHPVHRLLTQRKFLDYRWNYEYHDSTRLISKITDIDRQFVEFSWDGLGRLDSIKERFGAVITDFTYKYAGQDPNRPQTYVKQQLTYTPVDGSALQSQTVWQYFDDISRPFQTVKQSYSADSGFDVVSTVSFDTFSRPFKVYEDFEVANTDGFSVAVPNNTPFTLNTYEETPLNRLLTTTPSSWYTTNFEYGHNTVADAVMNLKTGMAYTEGLLSKEVVIDPNNHKTIVFKDKRGRPVLSRKEGETTTDRADTYSLFDAKERPSIIVPPAATLATPNLLFKTFYDGANNPILKKIPDMDILEMLYNNRDLIVAKQGGNLRQDGKWMVTTYDDYPRIQQTGLITEGGKPNPNNVVPSEVWTQSFYGGFKTTDFLDSLNIDGSNFAINVNADYLIGKLTTTKNSVLNGNSLTGQSILRVMDYNQYGQLVLDIGRNHYPNSVLNKTFTYDFADNLLTQSREFYTTDNNRLHRDTLSNTYDHQARLIDSYHSINNQGRQHISQLAYTAKDEVKTKFLGGTLSGFLQEINYEYLDNGFLSGINPTMSASDLFQLNINYDQMVTGLVETAQKNGNISQLSWKVQGQTEQTYGYNYDFQDRLKEANYGMYGTPARSSLVIGNEYSTTYGYDPRGNITHITRNGMMDTGNGYEDIQIDSLTFTPIAGTNKIEKIKDTAPCPDKKAIHLALDNTELHAVGSHLQADNVVNDNSTITYQAGDSIVLMSGFHAKAGTDFTARIDGCPEGGYETDGFVQRSEAVIEYDAEGNMTKDPNKGIDILFDYNNRPYKISWENGNTVEWMYDGTGTKLQKTVKRDSVEIPLYKQEYFDRIEFKNDTLESIYLTDAKVTHNNDNFDYSWYFKDHNQNTRVLFENNGNGVAQLTSEHHYYAFGSRFKGNFMSNSSAKYLFSTKEFNNDFGLGWSDFGYRFYMGDSGIPRFIGVDPIAERFPFVNPYNYAENKVPNGLDLHGLQLIDNKRAKINISAGGVSLKTENLSNPTKAQIVLAKPVTGRNESGSFITTTFPTTIGDVNFTGSSVNKRRPASSETSVVREVKDKFSGNSRDRRKQRRKNFNLPKGTKIITPTFIPPGSGGKGLGLLFIVSEGLNAITNQTIKRDLDAAMHQNDILANEAINIVDDAFSSDVFEAPEVGGFTTKQIQADLANFIFQGEFLNNYQGKDLERMTKLAEGLIQVNGIPLRSKNKRP